MLQNYRVKGAPYGLRLSVPVDENPGRRKLTHSAWERLEKYFGVRWFDINVVGGDSSFGPFELWHAGKLLGTLEREPEVTDRCPKCHQQAGFIRTALMCPKHGCIGGF